MVPALVMTPLVTLRQRGWHHKRTDLARVDAPYIMCHLGRRETRVWGMPGLPLLSHRTMGSREFLPRMVPTMTPPKGLIAPNIATLGTKLPIHRVLNSNHSSLLCELWIYIMFYMYKTCQNGSNMDSSPLAVSSGIGSPFFQNLALYQYCSLTGHRKKHLF